MIIIGITGTLGSGKGAIVNYLVNKRGFVHFSVRDLLVEEIKKRKMPINRDSMVKVGNDMRKKYGPSCLAKKLLSKANKSKKNCVIESLRNPHEVFALRKTENFYLFAIDAIPKIRYERIKKRDGKTDYVSYEEFIRDEKREMKSNNPNNQNISSCIKLADYKFMNNDTVKKLKNKVEKVLNEIQKC